MYIVCLCSHLCSEWQILLSEAEWCIFAHLIDNGELSLHELRPRSHITIIICESSRENLGEICCESERERERKWAMTILFICSHLCQDHPRYEGHEKRKTTIDEDAAKKKEKNIAVVG